MINENYTSEEKDNLVYLHLEIDNKRCTPRETNILKQYANVKYGDTISRYIIIPKDMPLMTLHFVIQRIFGWIDRYSHSFRLPDDIFYDITKDDTYRWAQLVGSLFPYLWLYNMGSENSFYKDNKKTNPEGRFEDDYTGPYITSYSLYGACNRMRSAVKQKLDDLKAKKGLDDSINIDKLSSYSSGDVENDEFLKYNANSLLLSIKVSSILATQDVNIKENQEMVKHYEDEAYFYDEDILPITHKLIYSYGPENKWIVNISRLNNFDSLVKDGLVDKEHVIEAEKAVLEKYKPFCVLKDGANVLDDVDNIPGFCNFLLDIFKNENLEKKKEALRFGRRRDWYFEEMDDPIIL